MIKKRISFFALLFLIMVSPVMSSHFAEAAPPAAVLSENDLKELKKVEDYFNNIQTLQASFFQSARNGNAAGTIYMRLPGEIRVEYAPPMPVLIVASNRLVSYYDTELQQLTEAPLSSTPLALMLQKPFTLRKDITITKIAITPQELQIIMYQTSEPDAGMLELVFSRTPFQIKYWKIIDNAGRTTQVSLGNIQLNIPLANNLFIRPSAPERRDFR